MKLQWKGFLAGVLLTALVCALASPTLAALAGKTIEVFTGVNVYVNDQLIQPKDANGNPVEVFVHNGTTYLPIRAIGNALGLPVQWEGKTNSAYVGKHQGDKPAVWLKDLDYFMGKNWVIYDGKNNLGEITNNAFTSSDRFYYNGGFENTYLINGQYSAISGTLFQTYEKRSNTSFDSKLEIYGDGELLYSATMKGGVKPLDFYVSLTGVLELKVIFNGSYSGGGFSGSGTYAAIADCGLWA